MANIIRTGGGGKPEQRKSATFTQNGVYTVNPDSGYVLSAVDILVNVASPTPVMQSKTVTPTGSQLTVTPDAGYSGLSSVTVNGDTDLKPSNVRKNINIYGTVGTLVASRGIADKVPTEYAQCAVDAEALVVAAGGSYANILILENTSYIAICFLTNSFAIQTYNTTTTEYTAIGFWYAQYDKTLQTWTLTDYTETTSTGSSFLNNGQFSTTTITYSGNKIFPVASITYADAETTRY